MGAVAEKLSDTAIVTDDNPRGRRPSAIRKQVLERGPDCRWEIGDRGLAIRTAVSELRQGDILVVAGKGHEQGQIVGENVYPFDDATEVARALKGETA